MQKILVIDSSKCTGCRICEQVCSVKHQKVVNPNRARIKIIKWEMEGEVLPMVCQQCDTPPCLHVCPMKTISKDLETGLVSIDYERCIGCRMCVAACPFGVMTYDWVDEKVIKCDLCCGEPQCVRFCDPQAIRFEEKSKITSDQRKIAAKQLKDVASALNVENPSI